MTKQNSKPKWTPGPWRTDYNSVKAMGNVDTISDPVWASIAYVEPLLLQDGEGRTWSTSGTPKANAHLIAAAPELYEALEALENLDFRDDCIECEGLGEPETCPLCFSIADNARLKRRAALAKARGESE